MKFFIKKAEKKCFHFVYNSMMKVINQQERFMMNIENHIFEELILIAKKNGVTVSWILRAILNSLHKKYKNNIHILTKIKRPSKFENHYSIFPLYFYGDKEKWKSISRLLQIELGAFVRFGISEFLAGKLKIDLVHVNTIKEIKLIKPKKYKSLKILSGGIYILLSDLIYYSKSDFWEKNSKSNVNLMNRGLSARKHIRKYGKIS